NNPRIEKDLEIALNLYRDRLRERFRDSSEDSKQALARLDLFSNGKKGQEILLGQVLEKKFPFCRHLALLTQAFLSDLGLREVRMQRGFAGGAHVWNEVNLGGQKRIIEITSAFHHGRDPLLKAKDNDRYQPETTPGKVE